MRGSIIQERARRHGGIIDNITLGDERVLQEVHKERALSDRTVGVSGGSSNIKFKTTFKNCVLDAMQSREWKQTWDDDWNVMWCEKEQIDWVF
jgi:hypothetical protein